MLSLLQIYLTIHCCCICYIFYILIEIHGSFRAFVEDAIDNARTPNEFKNLSNEKLLKVCYVGCFIGISILAPALVIRSLLK